MNKERLMRTPEEKNLLWRKAAIIGSIWAASEIVLGSFLHNIRLPFKGEILTAIGIAIITAGHRLWPERGLLWRAGLICAAMKSISPSANLTGPMVAIAMEGILADFGNRILGQNNIGRIFGGGLAMTWAITHKLVNYLIHYGSDFVAAANQTLQWFLKRFSFAKSLDGTIFGNIWGAMGFAMLIYFSLGIFASLMGILSAGKEMKTGKQLSDNSAGKSGKTEADSENGKQAKAYSEKKKQASLEITAQEINAAEERLEKSKNEELLRKTKKQFKYNASPEAKKFSLPLLFIQAAGIIAFFSIGKKMPLLPFISITALYSAFCAWQYKRARKLAMRWGVWLSIITASAIMGLILGQPSAGAYLAARAIIITFAFSAIGTELTNPAIRHFMEKAFGPVFFDALEYSFASLPGIIAAFPPAKAIFRQPLAALNKVISAAPYWLESSLARIFIIKGRQGSGKSTLMKEILKGLKQAGKNCGGFIAEGTWKNGKRDSFFLLRADSDEKHLLSSRRPELLQKENSTEEMKCGPFYFSAAGMKAGHDALSDKALKNCQYVFIDEIGPLELNGGGWAKDLIRIKDSEKTLVLSIRESMAEEIMRKFSLENAKVFSCAQENAEENSAKHIIKAMME